MMLMEHILVNFSLVFLSVFLCMYGYFKYCCMYWKRRKVPYLPPKFPLGNNEVLGPDALSYGSESQAWYNAFKNMGVRFGGAYSFCQPVLVLTDTEIIKDVMTKDFNYFVNRDFYNNPHDEPRAKTLFVTKDDEWKYMRRKITSAFTTTKLKHMFGCVSKCSELLVEMFEKAISKNDDIMLRLLIDNYTMDNIGVVAFGMNFNCLLTENPQFRKMADISTRPALIYKIKRVAARAAPEICQKLGVASMPREMSDFFANIVLENFERRKATNTRGNDFLQLVMDIKESSENDEHRITMDDVIANCLVYFLAGFDTSSKAIQYSLFELARNQELQDKARKEIKRVLDSHHGEFTYEGVQEMTYLRQIVDETMRLYPPVLTLTRVCSKDYKIRDSDTVIEKGTTVIISTIGLHRDPDLFPDPEIYDPDRFNPSNKANIVSYSYLPFGEGPRNCIGLRFGTMQAMTGLARILSNFKIDLSPKTKYPLHIKPGLFLLETEELYVRASRIQ